MSIINQPAATRFPDQAHAALEQLETLIHRIGLDGGVDEILRLVPGKRAIFKGWLDDRNVVFRLPLDEPNRNSFAKESQELHRARAYMNKGASTVVEPVMFDPDSSLTVIAYVPGTPLFTHLRSVGIEKALPLLSRSADWLRLYTGPTEEQRPFNHRRWRNKAAETAATQPHAALQPIETRISQKMNQLARKLGEREWRVAISHGDFHLNNLILNGETLVGIDTGGSARLPVYKDIARALTHMARRSDPPSGRRRFGVDAAAFDAYAETFEFDEIERDGFLPFMIAFETLIKVEHPQMAAKRIARTVEMSQSLFQDLRQVC